ncbi:unnamed protein product [Diplocarpon coronariae]|nr:hypothetical protein JHW43_004752 [Diplocarpon mali]
MPFLPSPPLLRGVPGWANPAGQDFAPRSPLEETTLHDVGVCCCRSDQAHVVLCTGGTIQFARAGHLGAGFTASHHDPVWGRGICTLMRRIPVRTLQAVGASSITTFSSVGLSLSWEGDAIAASLRGEKDCFSLAGCSPPLARRLGPMSPARLSGFFLLPRSRVECEGVTGKRSARADRPDDFPARPIGRQHQAQDTVLTRYSCVP